MFEACIIATWVIIKDKKKRTEVRYKNDNGKKESDRAIGDRRTLDSYYYQMSKNVNVFYQLNYLKQKCVNK